MSVLFLDSGALVKHYVAETGTPWVDSLLASVAETRICVVGIIGVEVVDHARP